MVRMWCLTSILHGKNQYRKLLLIGGIFLCLVQQHSIASLAQECSSSNLDRFIAINRVIDELTAQLQSYPNITLYQ